MKSKSPAAEMAETIMSRIRSKHKVGLDDVAPAVKQAAAQATKQATQKERAPARTKPAVAVGPAAAVVPAAPREPKPAPTPKVHPMCACGCGVQTRGGIYRPGHDSKHRSAQAEPKPLPDCKCGCGDKTKGGTFLPGHDAKYHSALRRLEKEEAEAKAKARGETIEAPPKKAKKAPKQSNNEATAA